jgi:hypothetical protein
MEEETGDFDSSYFYMEAKRFSRKTPIHSPKMGENRQIFIVIIELTPALQLSLDAGPI